MDVDACLAELIQLKDEALDLVDSLPPDSSDDDNGRLSEIAHRMAELVDALDGWLTGGGCPPVRWFGAELPIVTEPIAHVGRG